MTDDLISRKAALDAIDCWHIDFNSMDGAKVQTDCWKTIKELPAVDAAPVVHGQWYDKGSLSCRCSCCGCKSNKEYNYCPNCGAKMDSERRCDYSL